MHAVRTFFLGFAAGLPVGGLLVRAFGLRLRSGAQKVATAVTDFRGRVK